MRFFLAIFLLVSCAKGSHAPASESETTAKVAQLADKRQAKQAADAFTPELYQSPQDCDWTLWAGKAAAAGVAVSMDLVEYNPGEIHRRPKDQGECYPDHSESTVSNDQLTGYVLARFRASDLAALQRLQSYAESHNLVMGQGPISDTVLKEGLIVLIDRMVAKLGGLASTDPAPEYLGVTDDYARHVQTLQIVGHGEAHGSITDQMLQRLKDNDAAMPNTETFAAALAVYTGAYDHALDLLLDDATPLPTYVRGENPGAYAEVEWLWAADLVLRHFPKEAQ